MSVLSSFRRRWRKIRDEAREKRAQDDANGFDAAGFAVGLGVGVSVSPSTGATAGVVVSTLQQDDKSGDTDAPPDETNG